jgi:hypothetical protein
MKLRSDKRAPFFGPRCGLLRHTQAGSRIFKLWLNCKMASGFGLVYSCCSHLERRASVKRFVSLQFLNLRHSVGLLGRVISPSQRRYLTKTDIYASSGISTHDLSVRASEDNIRENVCKTQTRWSQCTVCRTKNATLIRD